MKRQQSQYVISLLVGAMTLAGTVQAQSKQSEDTNPRQGLSGVSNFLRAQRKSSPSRGFRLMPPEAYAGVSQSRINPLAAPNPVVGSGSAGRLAKWTGVFGANTFAIGDSAVTEDKFGKVGIGTSNPTSPLTVAGLIQSLSGGIKFPDGTIQATSASGALFSISHDATLTGDGTAGSPLGVAVPLTLIGSLPGAGIINVTNLDSLGAGVFARGASSGTAVEALGGSAAGEAGGTGVSTSGGNSETGLGGIGILAKGGLSSVIAGMGVRALGASSSNGVAGAGVSALGGSNFNNRGGEGVNATGGFSSNGRGGIGLIGLGGFSDGSTGGEGMSATGGDTNTGDGGIGVDAQGGDSNINFAGDGVRAAGGNSTGGRGGDGVRAIGGVGPLGDGLAGDFNGDVDVSGMLSKGGGSFKIDHPLDPENRYLYHSFVESPDMKNIYDGVITLDSNGEAFIELPEWFQALNRDFRYLLTAIGVPMPGLYVAQKVKENRFKVAGGQPGMEVSWQVTGIRQDAWANKNRISVEVEKSERDRGLYLHPESLNQPEELGIDWARNPEIMKQRKEARELARQKQL